MNNRSGNLSDIDLARQLSRRLTGLAAGAPATGKPLPAPGYQPFRIAAKEAATAPPVTVQPEQPADPFLVEAEPAPAPPKPVTSWEEFLAWSLELAGGRAAFVVDSQGFVIASRGRIPDDGFEAVGAELCLAMEQLDRLDQDAGILHAIELVFQNHRIIGMRGHDEERGTFVVGFVVVTAVGGQAQQMIIEHLAASLPVLE